MTDKTWLSNRLAWHNKRAEAHKCTCHACWAGRHRDAERVRVRVPEVSKSEQRRELAAQRSHLEGRILKLDDEIRCAERNADACRKLEQLPEAQRRALLEGSWKMVPKGEPVSDYSNVAPQACLYCNNPLSDCDCPWRDAPTPVAPELARGPVCNDCGLTPGWCLC